MPSLMTMTSEMFKRGALALKVKWDVHVRFPLAMVRLNSRMAPFGTLSETVMSKTSFKLTAWSGFSAGMVAVFWLMVTSVRVLVVRVAVAVDEATLPTFLMTMSNDDCSPYSSCWLPLASCGMTSVMVSTGSLMTWMVPT